MSLAVHSGQTAPSKCGCRCLLLRWWCHCKFSASMADCGAILNRSIFPECLWLIWHFSLNPSLCLLQPAALSFSLHLSIHLSLSFHCCNSRLPLLKHLSSLFTPCSFRSQTLCLTISSPLNIHQVNFNQHFLITWDLIFHLHLPYKMMHHISSTGQKKKNQC